MALFNYMIKPGYPDNSPQRENVSLKDIVHHIDHICQLVGNANSVGIGSDMDGGFGVNRIPHELQTICDLPKLADVLSAKGFSDVDVKKIMFENWQKFFMQNLPES